MLIAQEIRKTNIAEYILYMWQVEDLLRACSFNPENIENKLVQRFKADEDISREIADWYKNLAMMMENIQKVRKAAQASYNTSATQFAASMQYLQQQQQQEAYVNSQVRKRFGDYAANSVSKSKGM